MKLNLFRNRALLEWNVPEEWNRHVYKLKNINWEKALKSIFLLSLLWIISFYLFSEWDLSSILVIIISIGFSTFLYFLGRFTRWASHPNATIYESTLLVNYWEGTDEIKLKDIDSYRFKKLNINNEQVSVLEIKLNDNSYFEVGIPNSEFEEEVKSILSKELSIPYLGSFKP